jgi:histidinol phosphatase-like PHP family hydrolase
MIKMDMHTHSNNFSDGKTDIITNLRMAEALQLDLMACTDHLAIDNGNTYQNGQPVDAMIDIVNANKSKLSFPLLAGAEAEILSAKGDVMISEETYYKLDFVIAHALKVEGLHRNTPAKKSTFIDNHIAAYINVANHPLVDCIGHPFNFGRLKPDFQISLDDFPDDLIQQMAAAMKATDTLFDMMNEVWWWYPDVTINDFENQYKRIIKICTREGVKFVTSSDAHMHQGIGNIGWSVRMLQECDVPEAQIFNLNDLAGLKQRHTKTQRPRAD